MLVLDLWNWLFYTHKRCFPPFVHVSVVSMGTYHTCVRQEVQNGPLHGANDSIEMARIEQQATDVEEAASGATISEIIQLRGR